jgi:hypothetical protein
LGILVFTVIHVGLSWALSVILSGKFVDFAFGIFPFIASFGFTLIFIFTTFLASIRYVSDLKPVIADVFHWLAGLLLGDTLSGGRAKDQALEIENIDIGVIRRWSLFWSTVTKVIISGWFAVVALALFRVQIAQYNPIIVVLLTALFISLTFRRWVIAFVLFVLIGGYFILVDAKIVDEVRLSDVKVSETSERKPNNLMPAKTVVIHGGMIDWITVYRDLPYTNRFKVENMGGSLQIAGSKNELIDCRGSLMANGIPLSLNAEHLISAGIEPEHWLVHGDDVAPYCLIACVTEEGQSPADAIPFKVGWRLIVEKDQSLHFWYNHVLKGEFKESYKNDRGSYRVRLTPLVTVD